MNCRRVLLAKSHTTRRCYNVNKALPEQIQGLVVATSSDSDLQIATQALRFVREKERRDRLQESMMALLKPAQYQSIAQTVETYLEFSYKVNTSARHRPPVLLHQRETPTAKGNRISLVSIVDIGLSRSHRKATRFLYMLSIAGTLPTENRLTQKRVRQLSKDSGKRKMSKK
ncbi:hypothetical protein K458DRAFT_387653 [Lentithecium fluviatile CBS 122367]|uniref:Uncharacterized protein n=1 Tax=Lentithecium fluviatile CBS 122367 TaxID=1168545 RepID=A0A6G1J5A5_9PLEO|nr:hypothetical protein K458DRAFT_387653 [Lentithecium fluviatile CBS 122367]